MDLSPRLRTVARLVSSGARFADIGTDHAYLPVWLILNGVIETAIAADLRPGPLQRACETAERYAVADRVDFRLCDGLTGIQPGEADTVAIAGMGGETIAHILAAAPWTCQPGVTLILQPMSTQPELRSWLGENGYQITQEHTAREDKTLYTILRVEAGAMPPLTPAELWAGRQSGDPLRGELLDSLIRKARRALEGRLTAVHRDERAITDLSEIVEGLIQMKKEWDGWQR
jgi:tRNA (adenine22-N1)-methyltransferase